MSLHIYFNLIQNKKYYKNDSYGARASVSRKSIFYRKLRLLIDQQSEGDILIRQFYCRRGGRAFPVRSEISANFLLLKLIL